MAIGVAGGVVVTGMRELDIMLRQMTPELNHRILGAANAAASKPLIASAKSKAPKGRTGNLVKSIGSVKISTRKATEIGTVHVGPRRGGGFKGYHGHLVEFGTGSRPPGGWYARFPGAKDTVMPASPFMKPALEQTRDQIIGTQKEYIAVKLHAFMKRKLGKAFIK
jgi:HK97 gp10 family phage protein